MTFSSGTHPSRRFYPHFERLESRLAPALFVVNSTDDFPDVMPGNGVAADKNGNVTLRAAIQEVEALGGTHTINFAIGKQGFTQTIALTANLDKISKAQVTIDGSTQLDPQDVNPAPAIVIDGQNANDGILFLDASGNTVRWLNIINCPNFGIAITGKKDVGGNVVERNFIGLKDGQSQANGVGINLSEAQNNTIKDNVISGNTIAGIQIEKGSTNTTVYGNLIGISNDGLTPLAKKQAIGVAIIGAPGNFIGVLYQPRNTISNNGTGILIANEGANGNVVAGNYIGVDAKGDGPLPNDAGIAIRNCDNNIIGEKVPMNGGSLQFASNVISGNDAAGISINAATGTKIYGNYIGVAANGTTARPNQDDGITIFDSDNTIVGGGLDGRNVIANNAGNGVLISGVESKGNVIRGNRIGRNNAGEAAKNTGDAIHFEDAQKANNTVEENEISFSGGSGIHVASGSGVLILNNDIQSNDVNGIRIATGVSDVTASGNIIRLSGQDGVWSSGANVTVTNNTVNNSTGTGILIANATGILNVNVNNVSQNTQDGISINATDTVFANNNTISSNDGNGLVLLGGLLPWAEDNSVSQNKQDGIRLAGANQVLLKENIVTGNLGDGVEVATGTSHVLQDNTLTGNLNDLHVIGGASQIWGVLGLAGTVQQVAGELDIIGSPGSAKLTVSAQYRMMGGDLDVGNGGTLALTGSGAAFHQTGGDVTIQGGTLTDTANFRLDAGRAEFNNASVDIDGELQANGGLLVVNSNMTVDGGVLIASAGVVEAYWGMLTGSLTNAGTMRFGSPTDTDGGESLAMSGSFAQTASGQLKMGLGEGGGDFLSTGAGLGNASLAGLFSLVLAPGYAPPIGTTMTAVGYMTGGGEFALSLPPLPEGVWEWHYNVPIGTGFWLKVVSNSPPNANDDSAVTAVNTPVMISVLGNDTDPDGHPLTVTQAGPASNGSVVIDPGGMTVTYTPNQGFQGIDTFSYTASDGHGGTDSAMVTVTVGQPQLLDGKIGPGVASLTTAELQPVIAEAIAQLHGAGFSVVGLGLASFVVADLYGSLLGVTHETTIWIDANAAGHGWYIEEVSGGVLNGGPFAGVDLLTVVTHELGHVLGFASIDPAIQADDWMTATLATGVRRLPTVPLTAEVVAGIFAGAQDTVADDALFGPEQIPQPREDDLFAFDFFATSPAQLVVTAPAALGSPVVPLLNHSTTDDAAPLAADDLDLAEPMPAGDGEQLLLGGAGTQIVIGEENGMCLVGGFV